MYVHELVRSGVTAGFLVWYLASVGISVTAPQWILFTGTILLGAVGLYGFYFSIATLSFWIENLFNVGDLFREIMDAAKRPSDIFTGVASTIVTFVIPVGLIATIPTKILLGTEDWSGTIWMIVSSIALFGCARLFFLASLRRYSSASS